MTQRRGLPGAGDRDRGEADLLDRPGVDPRAHRRGDHLAAQADAQRRPVEHDPPGETGDLAADPGMSIGLIDPHRPAHHHDEIGRIEIDIGEIGIGHVDPVDRIARGLDGRTETGNAFIRRVADDERGFHAPKLAAERTKPIKGFLNALNLYFFDRIIIAYFPAGSSIIHGRFGTVSSTLTPSGFEPSLTTLIQA